MFSNYILSRSISVAKAQVGGGGGRGAKGLKLSQLNRKWWENVLIHARSFLI